jgi:hypothetical protein
MIKVGIIINLISAGVTLVSIILKLFKKDLVAISFGAISRLLFYMAIFAYFSVVSLYFLLYLVIGVIIEFIVIKYKYGDFNLYNFAFSKYWHYIFTIPIGLIFVSGLISSIWRVIFGF